MKKTQRRIDRLERIIETQSLLAQANLDLDAFMQLVVDILQELTEAKGAVVELVDGDYMVYRCASGAIAKHVGLRLLRTNSLSGLCVTVAQVLRCDDAEVDPRVDAAACRKVGVRSMICTPLFEEGIPVGVLKVMSEQARGFDEDDVQTLSLLGTALGAALGKQVAFAAVNRAQAQLLVSEERMRTILEQANDAVISIDRIGIVSQWNRSAERLFGWSCSEAMGCNVVDLVVPPSMRTTFHSAITHFDAGQSVQTEVRQEVVAVDRQLNELSVEVSLNVNNIAGHVELTAFLHDISERKQLEKALRNMALSDGLTGISNRRGFMETLERSIARQQRHETGLALLFMDLNRFKQINDTFGHDVGDHVLKEFAFRVSGCLRETDTVARLGGDEFVVLAEGISEVEHVLSLARKIVATLKAPVSGTSISITASIGVCLFSRSMDAEKFLRGADIAMYQAKHDAGEVDPVSTVFAQDSYQL